MNTNKLLLLGALAGLAAIAINKQLRLTRRRFEPLSEYSKREARTRASVDDVPAQGPDAPDPVAEFDEQIAPAAPM
jgi:hypothetical protein